MYGNFEVKLPIVCGHACTTNILLHCTTSTIALKMKRKGMNAQKPMINAIAWQRDKSYLVNILFLYNLMRTTFDHGSRSYTLNCYLISEC